MFGYSSFEQDKKSRNENRNNRFFFIVKEISKNEPIINPQIKLHLQCRSVLLQIRNLHSLLLEVNCFDHRARTKYAWFGCCP